MRFVLLYNLEKKKTASRLPLLANRQIKQFCYVFCWSFLVVFKNGLFIFLGGVPFIAEYMINEKIRDREIRLIDSDGEMLGIFASRDAQRMADEKNMDLVKISPNARPPVCKIMDYSKFKFEQAKKEREA